MSKFNTLEFSSQDSYSPEQLLTPIDLSQPTTLSSPLTVLDSSPLTKKAVMRLSLYEDRVAAKALLDSYQSVVFGWCRVIDLVPNKIGGYVQLSYLGVNKGILLHELLLVIQGKVCGDGMQISHRCNQPKCMIPAHVCVESATSNNSRKNCEVWFPCSHCKKLNWICRHEPSCIKYHPKLFDGDMREEHDLVHIVQ